MASSANHTINIAGRALCKEGVAAAALTVGQHVNRVGGEVAVRGIGPPTRMLVAEAPERGKGVLDAAGNPTTYAAGEQVPYLCPASGDEVLLLLATGQNVAEGDLLEAAAAGEWTALTTGVAGFIALEAMNNTSGAGALLHAQAL